MKIMLCTSYYLNRHQAMLNQPYLYLPLGPLYVAAVLKNIGWDVVFFDSTFARNESEFETAVHKQKPAVVGIHSAITSRIAARNMIRIAKAAGAVVVAGGPDPTVSCADYLQWGADFVIMGEGEATMTELVFHLSQADTPSARDTRGIAYHNGSEVVINPPQNIISDLDQLPWPARELIDVEPYQELWQRHHGYFEMHLLTSRGCPFTCTWCSRAVFGRTFRQRSVDNVVREMAELRSVYGIDRLWIADDTFGLSRKWLESWCNEVVERNLQIPFRCMTRIDLVDQEMIQRLRSAGCYQINLGVESGSQRILNAMNKRTRITQIRSSSRIIQDAGIGLGYFIMFGYPGETFADIRKTERLLYEINPDSVGYSVAYPVPGTEFHDRVKDQLLSTVGDDLWERSLEGPQRLFRTEYPLIYYRALIRFLENRQRFLQMQGISISRLKSLATTIATSGLRWILELWTLIRKAISVNRDKETYDNGF